jgi:hypothetical protein
VQMSDSPILQIRIWHIDGFVFHARSPRQNDAVVDHMCASVREFGGKIPVLAHSDGTVVDGHLPNSHDLALRMANLTGEEPILVETGQTMAEVAVARGVPVEQTVNPKQNDSRRIRHNGPAPFYGTKRKAG